MQSQQNELLLEDSKKLGQVLDAMGEVIVGQREMTRSLVIGLLTGGHVLLEGLPGLAKTLAVKTLAQVIDAKFQRIQFTPDLLPSDLIGTVIYRQQTQDFVPKKGPIFTNLVLADEINRAPAKVQSALLEAMAEKQVTIGEETFALEKLFLVLATQNPIEQEGTYPLPEAQLDRFMFKLRVLYPSRTEEKQILERLGGQHIPQAKHTMTPDALLTMRTHLDHVFVDERIKEYILRLVLATRAQEKMDSSEIDTKNLQQLRGMIRMGASPRATLFLHNASKANALIEGRSYIIPDDIKAVLPEVFRHRLILTFEAEADRISVEDVIDRLLNTVVVP